MLGDDARTAGPFEKTALLEVPDDDRFYFSSSIEGDGFTVDVSITVTGQGIGGDVHEVSEHAQMVASRIASLGRGSSQHPNAGPFRPSETPAF